MLFLPLALLLPLGCDCSNPAVPTYPPAPGAPPPTEAIEHAASLDPNAVPALEQASEALVTRATKLGAAALLPLKSQLAAALQEQLAEDPVAAIGVCRALAPALAQELAPQGMKLGRTSLKLRNGANAPAPWMEGALLAMEQEHGGGGAQAHVMPLFEGRAGYLEPIVVQDVCLACHGEPSGAVADRISQLYPGDAATGFAAGELRGAFWVELDAELLVLAGAE